MTRFARVILCWAFALQVIGVSLSPAADEPPRASAPTSPKDEPPVYIILDGASDLDSIRKKLGLPDFVILKGARFNQLMDESKPIVPSSKSVVESVSVTGEILDDLAHLKVDFQIANLGAEPTWVPIRLNGQIVVSAQEADRDLPIRSVDGSWQIRVEGDGPHRVRVELTSVVLPAKGGASSRRLEWAIPEAASTRLQVSLPANTSDFATIGVSSVREPLTAEPIEGGQRHRVSAYLTPRRNLEIQWNLAADPNSEGPPIVTAQGEIALDIERGSMNARSSWEVRSKRGTTRRLEIRIDPADELVGLECDGRPVAGTEPRDAASGAIVVPLLAPLGPEESCRLVITTRRALSPESSTRLTYRGLPLLNVVAQSGTVAISQTGGDPWVTASPGRGLRAIDPRTELSASLRTRPSIVLAYQFVEQPFELGLQVDPSPPEIRVESRTTVAVDPRTAKVDSTLDYIIARGRVFETRVSLPQGMLLDSVGPDSVVAASQVLPRKEGERPILVVRLTARAIEEGRFSVRLLGRQLLASASLAKIGLPRPTDCRHRGGLLAVLTSPGTAVELVANLPGIPPDFVKSNLEVPASWPWPIGVETASIPPALWLRADESPSSISLVVSARKQVVVQESTLEVIIDRRKIDTRQDTILRGRFGVISTVEVSVPKDVIGSWEVEGIEVARRESLGRGTDGSERYRVTFTRAISDRESLRFRIVQPWKKPLEPGVQTQHLVPYLTILDAELAPIRVRVGSDEGIDISGSDSGWTTILDEPLRGSIARIERTSLSPAIINVTAHAFARLPHVVVSRLSLVSSKQVDGGLQTSASYRLESHTNSLVVVLPTGAQWVRARVGTETIAEVEQVSKPAGGYRLKLPGESSGPLLVTLDYSQGVKDLDVSGSWTSPRLQEDAIIQETLWEIRVPSGLALLGLPSNWSDLNRWEWAGYVFMRRPATARVGVSDDGLHGYLFGQIGEPAPISPMIVSRANLVGICSGVVLALGLLAMSIRGSGLLFSMIFVVAALIAIVTVPTSVIPQVAQSSALGFVLLLVAAVTRRLLDRRRPLPRINVESSGLILGGSSGSRFEEDGSTVIRARAGTTVDRLPSEVPDGATTSIPG